MLVAAFRATLEEVVAADLILHVRDVSHEDAHAQAEDVAKVLKDLDIDEARRRWDVLEVWNKIDRVTELRQRRELSGKAARLSHVVLVSALTGEGIDDLLEAIENRLAERSLVFEVVVTAAEGSERNWLTSTRRSCGAKRPGMVR